ncbi:MAG TPA: hypothetical protein VNZ45_02560, partial [Bacteroidia bacterium]|nr:hypothetical protein [Bacteroidia bacterium]
YTDYCDAQSGRDNQMGVGSLYMLCWLLELDYESVSNNSYSRGEKLYKNGVRYKWNSQKRKNEKIIIDIRTNL